MAIVRAKERLQVPFRSAACTEWFRRLGSSARSWSSVASHHELPVLKRTLACSIGRCFGEEASKHNSVGKGRSNFRGGWVLCHFCEHAFTSAQPSDFVSLPLVRMTGKAPTDRQGPSKEFW
ncbi:unnamed protein product [Prunus armeniaca]|uniref:Uncharacterized protein n=1 Tax=Prunus armeniaca TaxID=36596 RepID=A0A6J5XX81_PRUAR|nr:unnamed protein product [Prunus armeniaca]